jgi:hypothetical protein
MNARITDAIHEMRVNTSVQKPTALQLHACVIDESAAKLLSDAMRTSLLQLCYLSSSHMSPASLDYFIASLTNQTRLTSLALWANPKAKRATVAALHLSSMLPNLQQVFVDISDDNIDEVTELIERNRTLRQLMIRMQHATCAYLIADVVFVFF